MAGKAEAARDEATGFQIDWGTVFTVLSGLSFLFMSMLLPLVGKAAVQTVHTKQNIYAFLAALMVSLGTAVIATTSKMIRRRTDNSPLPVFSIILCALNALLLVALLLGLLHI